MALSADLLAEFDHEMANLHRALERAPDERWDWRPHPKSRTLGELAAHLAGLPGWIPGMLAADAYDLADDGKGATKAIPLTRDAVLAAFDANRAAARAAMGARDDVALHAPWALKRDGVILRTMPKSAALRAFVLDHVIHHRGQLTVYLRLLDVPVPALYGSSADERM